MKLRLRLLALTAAVALLGTLTGPAGAKEYPPQVARGVTVPVGFAATVFAQLPPGMLPTSLTWGPSTAPEGVAGSTADAARRHGTLLYVTATMGEGFGLPAAIGGVVIAYSDEGTPTIAAQGLAQPLGVVMGPDKTLYVTETTAGVGKVTALEDTDADGVFETRETVIGNLPNGRHQTNGLVFGPDGMLYVANGNATDDGLECGPAMYPGASEACTAGEHEVLPWSGSILRVNPAWRDVDLQTDIVIDGDGVRAADGMDLESVLVARGMRNIYDVEFDPRQPNVIWTPMNGPDNPSGSDPLYAIDTTNQGVVGGGGSGPWIEDIGFPSCLYDPHVNDFPVPQPFGHEHAGIPEPQDNPNQAVIQEFGNCGSRSVHRPVAVFAEGHEGTSGIAFTRGANFPERYAGDVFVAEWGSLWNLNGGKPNGHKIIHLELDPSGRTVERQREFMSGVLPMDVAFNDAGHMFVADMSGQIYQVQHVTDAAAGDAVQVDMVQNQFVPAVTTIVRGQTVCWVNGDAVAHTVTSVNKVVLVDPLGSASPVQDGSELNSPGGLAPGAIHCHTFNGTPGAYHYHSTGSSPQEANLMRGTVVVLPVER